MDADDHEIASLLRGDENAGHSRPSHRRTASASRSARSLPRRTFQRAAHIVKRRPLVTLLVFSMLVFSMGTVLVTNQYEVRVDMSDALAWLKNRPSTDASHESGGKTRKPPRTPSTDVMSYGCLEAWVARGALCLEFEGLDRMRASMAKSQIDAVWTWVNGSDPRHQLSRDFWTKQDVNASIYDMQPPRSRWSRELDPREDPPSNFTTFGHDPLANGKNSKWFRDHDELKFSMRAVNMHLQGLRTMHVMATDFRHPFHAPHDDSLGVDYGDVGFTDVVVTPDDRTNGGRREGQWPQWLDHEKLLDWRGMPLKDAKVRVQHHWNVFTLPEDAGEDPTNWKNRALPSFNSYSIESQLVNLEDLHEAFIYNNDDFFLAKPFSTSDFHTPLYGPVYRMRPTSGVNWEANDTHSDPAGEAAQLHRSAWALGDRFGFRRRPYIEHVTKSYSRPILAETRMMFPEEFKRTSEHRFRGLGQDIVAVFMANHVNVERHREALLWSFLVARGDRDGDGWVSRAELSELLDFVGEGEVNETYHTLQVDEPRRMTLGGIGPILEGIGMDQPKQTIYWYTSQDGYPYFRPAGEGQGWPKVYAKNRNRKLCTLELARCIPEYYSGMDGIWADHLMKRFAFDWQDCGDCLIMRLVDLSGPRGLSAFLPDDNTYFPTPSIDKVHASSTQSQPPTKETADVHSATSPFNAFGALIDAAFGRNSSEDGTTTKPSWQQEELAPVAFLPLAARWIDVDFSLTHVQATSEWPADRTRREFAMRLIQRYSYIMAHSLFYFSMLKKPDQALDDFRKIDGKKPALVCINDDIEEGREIIDAALENWLQQRFSMPLPFELPPKP